MRVEDAAAAVRVRVNHPAHGALLFVSTRARSVQDQSQKPQKHFQLQ